MIQVSVFFYFQNRIYIYIQIEHYIIQSVDIGFY